MQYRITTEDFESVRTFGFAYAPLFAETAEKTAAQCILDALNFAEFGPNRPTTAERVNCAKWAAEEIAAAENKIAAALDEIIEVLEGFANANPHGATDWILDRAELLAHNYASIYGIPPTAVEYAMWVWMRAK